MQNMTLCKLRIAQNWRHMGRNGFLIRNQRPQFSVFNPFFFFCRNIHFNRCQNVQNTLFATLVANCMKMEADREKNRLHIRNLCPRIRQTHQVSSVSFIQTSNLLHSGIIAEIVLQLMVATLLVQQYVCYHCNINVSRRWTSHTGC